MAQDCEAAGLKISKAQMDPAPEPAAPEPAPATPDTAVPPETEQGDGYPAEAGLEGRAGDPTWQLENN